jgi:hypothetical protein
MSTRGTWFGTSGIIGLCALLIAGCGGTGGGGGGNSGFPDEQFVLNSNNSGRLTLNVDPTQVDANKSDRLGLVATLTDSAGHPIQGTTIVFVSDIPDITFIPLTTVAGRNVGVAVTDAHGNADIIAVAGSSPTGTGAIVGTGAIFAEPPPAFGLRAQVSVTLLDIGFVDASQLGLIPASMDLTEPPPGVPIFFNIVGGTPPYQLLNEVSGVGAATLSQHCAPGCTANGGVLCVGSPCQSDTDCGAGSPTGTCIGPISRCLASCHGTNCAGSRCEHDADCNDGSPTPAHVCADSGQSILFITGAADSGESNFVVTDAQGASVTGTVTISTFCGSGVARGTEQCDGHDLRGETCASQGFGAGGTLLCKTDCTFDTSKCFEGTPGPGATPTIPVPTDTPTATIPATPTVTDTPTPTSTPAPLGTPGAPVNLALALLTNCAGNNGNGTLTTVVSATVSDGNSNPVSDGTAVLFSITGPNIGAVINSPSQTNTNPPCSITNFVTQCMFPVVNQHGVAHTCITYPIGQNGTVRTVNGQSAPASDSQPITLPDAPALTPTPTPTMTP